LQHGNEECVQDVVLPVDPLWKGYYSGVVLDGILRVLIGSQSL